MPPDEAFHGPALLSPPLQLAERWRCPECDRVWWDPPCPECRCPLEHRHAADDPMNPAAPPLLNLEAWLTALRDRGYRLVGTGVTGEDPAVITLRFEKST
jgi:hypothetical protein